MTASGRGIDSRSQPHNFSFEKGKGILQNCLSLVLFTTVASDTRSFSSFSACDLEKIYGRFSNEIVNWINPCMSALFSPDQWADVWVRKFDLLSHYFLTVSQIRLNSSPSILIFLSISYSSPDSIQVLGPFQDQIGRLYSLS